MRETIETPARANLLVTAQTQGLISEVLDSPALAGNGGNRIPRGEQDIVSAVNDGIFARAAVISRCINPRIPREDGNPRV